MINKIFIIYIEGKENPMPKQEKNLFVVPQSLRIWNIYFSNVGYEESMFQIFPKIFAKDATIEKFLKIIDSKLKNFYEDNDDSNNVKLKILVTGDHDEVKDEVRLAKTEKIAELLKKRFKAEIILERKHSFKIESLMNEIVGTKINKKILRDKVGKEFPNMKEFLKAFCVSEEKMIENLENSKHPLFLEINKIKLSQKNGQLKL